jgi:hypothetical protein
MPSVMINPALARCIRKSAKDSTMGAVSYREDILAALKGMFPEGA